jgi:hypothetical protein
MAEGNMLVFLGAGVGVPLGLPTATDFGSEISAGSNEITEAVVRYLGDLGSDIEWVLSTLNAFTSETDFTEFIYLERVNTDSNARVEMAKLKRAASEEITRLKKTLFNTPHIRPIGSASLRGGRFRGLVVPRISATSGAAGQCAQGDSNTRPSDS